MTRNQISYWTLEENKRSNRVNEAETQRSNKAREKETNRHNLATEEETHRHNVATELLTSQAQAEQARHNGVTEMQNSIALAETERSHRANEGLQLQQIYLGYANLGLGYAQLEESQRHNAANEKFNLLNLAETERANEAREQISRDQLDETIRSNKANETINTTRMMLDNAQKAAALAEETRHNITVEEETERNNKTRNVFEGLTTLNELANGASKRSMAFLNTAKSFTNSKSALSW